MRIFLPITNEIWGGGTMTAIGAQDFGMLTKNVKFGYFGGVLAFLRALGVSILEKREY